MVPTQHTLVARLREHGSNADWERFYLLYEAPILAFARAYSLDESECRDVLQETMVRMLRGGFERFDPAKGRFTGFLFNVAKGCVVDAIRRRNRHSSCEISLENLSRELENQLVRRSKLNGVTPAEAAERAGQIALIANTMELLIRRRCFQPRTVAIFRAVTFEAAAPHEVARRYNTTVGNIYEAKRAVLSKLRQTLQVLERGGDPEETTQG
jgi:RNA polymerase sigma factor (sigma-70 family)